ncbi:hypothetical protein KKG71_05430 [Patescibacteria group bacterium]|nr:hypothetical protein [Patescibacteria group bacterium]
MEKYKSTPEQIDPEDELVDCEEAENEELKAAVLAHASVEVIGLEGGLTEEISGARYAPHEDTDHITWVPKFKCRSHATRSKRLEKMESFIPKVEAFEGKAYKSLEAANQDTSALQKEIDEHNTRCKQASFGVGKLIAEAFFTIQGSRFKIAIHQPECTQKLDLSITFHRQRTS